MKNRMKNVWFWVGVAGVALTAMGVDASTLTSWSAVGQALINLISNPFLLGSTALAIVGVFVNPSTKGLKD